MEPITTIAECAKAIEAINKFLRAYVKETSPEILADTESADSPEVSYLEEFTDLRSLLNSDKWPSAIDPDLICSKTSESDKTDRADGILEVIVKQNLYKKRFLDFGCGEGHVVKQALLQSPEIAIGYDIKSFDSVPWGENFLTTQFQTIQNSQPYDIILMNDVLDHIIDEDPVEVLKRVKLLLNNDGILIVRCHPWCSRHGGHLYHQNNKAFIHLAFSIEELMRMGIYVEPMQKITDPTVYFTWFQKAGLSIVKDSTTITDVEKFFINTDLLSNRFKIPTSSLSQSFIDYVIKRNN